MKSIAYAAVTTGQLLLRFLNLVNQIYNYRWLAHICNWIANNHNLSHSLLFATLRKTALSVWAFIRSVKPFLPSCISSVYVFHSSYWKHTFVRFLNAFNNICFHLTVNCSAVICNIKNSVFFSFVFIYFRNVNIIITNFSD